MAQVLPANVRPVVWLKRRSLKAGTFYNPRVKSSEMRSVKLSHNELLCAEMMLGMQQIKNEAKKARFARK